MPSRTAKFVSALFASLIAGAPLSTALHSAPAEAEKCLAGPKGTAPQGGHWYYRVDRATKRQCWYIGDAKEKAARPAPASSSASADSAAPPKNATAQKTLADARAELSSPPMRAEPDFKGQRAAAPAANAPGIETSQRANVWEPDTQPSMNASRWPQSSDASSSASPAPATYPPVADLPPDAANTAPAPAPAAAPAILPVAADSLATRHTGSIQTLLIVIIGALSVAGLMGSAIFRFSSQRRTGARVDRHAIWDSVRPSRPADPDFSAPMPAADIHHETRASDDPNRRVTEMLARLSRTAAT